MEQEIYILDLVGTFSFAVYGAYYAQKKDFDVFGIFVAAFLSAVGGGTIREMILGNIPFYFFDMNYIYTILIGSIFAITMHHIFHRINTFMLTLDSIGLVTFAFIGASKASSLEMNMFGILFFATITAVGGGVLRDLVLNRVPKIMYYDFYATIALLLGFIYGIFPEYMQDFFWANMLITTLFFLRIFVLFHNIHLWKPINKKK